MHCNLRRGCGQVLAKHRADFRSAYTVQTEADKMAAQAVNVLITGANRGLGLEMVKQMVEGKIPVRKMFACCRDPDGPRAEVRSPKNESVIISLDSFHASWKLQNFLHLQALRTLAKEHPNKIYTICLGTSFLFLLL